MSEEIRFYLREEPYGFLSNFWREPIDFGYGTKPDTYQTNEHYYQSQKAKSYAMKEWIRRAPTAYAAMTAGRNLRPEEMVQKWETKKTEVMLEGLRKKFHYNNTLRYLLLWTGDAILIEDSPTDMFWGGALPGSQNMLGKLLVQVRDEIKENVKRRLDTPMYGDGL
ncbi:MAG: NADAR family protein [Proteobacteria bacterium]|jgi:hypothetical protein|nr:NADAR family protein [Pseudomonadota bacterium]